MNYHQGQFGFWLPSDQIEQSPLFVRFEAEVVEAWQAELDDTQLGTQAKSIFHFFQHMNQTQLEPAYRFELLEQTKTQVHLLGQTLARKYLDNPEIAYESRFKIFMLMKGIYQELITGYQLCLEGFGLKARKTKALGLVCLHRIALYDLEMIYRSYEMFTTPDSRFWGELHLCYQHACHAKVLQKPVEACELSIFRHETLERLYHHALIFGCTNPFRLRLNDMQLLASAIEGWVDLICLSHVSLDESSHYCVDLTLESGPKYRDEIEAFHDWHLAIDMSELLAHLEQLKASRSGETSVVNLSAIELSLSLPFIQTLIQSFELSIKRDTDRQETHDNLQVVFGLEPIMHQLVHFGYKVETPTWVSDGFIEVDGETNPAQAHKKPIAFDVETLNQSMQGFCFAWHRPWPSNIKAGDLIGVFHEQSDTVQVGVIRWLKQASTDVIHTGVQLLAHEAKPVDCIIETHDKPLCFHTLLMPKKGNNPNELALLTPALPFKAEMTVTFLDNNHEHSLFLREAMETNPNFTQFEVVSKTPVDAFFQVDDNDPLDKLA